MFNSLKKKYVKDVSTATNEAPQHNTTFMNKQFSFMTGIPSVQYALRARTPLHEQGSVNHCLFIRDFFAVEEKMKKFLAKNECRATNNENKKNEDIIFFRFRISLGSLCPICMAEISGNSSIKFHFTCV